MITTGNLQTFICPHCQGRFFGSAPSGAMVEGIRCGKAVHALVYAVRGTVQLRPVPENKDA